MLLRLGARRVCRRVIRLDKYVQARCHCPVHFVNLDLCPAIDHRGGVLEERAGEGVQPITGRTFRLLRWLVASGSSEWQLLAPWWERCIGNLAILARHLDVGFAHHTMACSSPLCHASLMASFRSFWNSIREKKARLAGPDHVPLNKPNTIIPSSRKNLRNLQLNRCEIGTINAHPVPRPSPKGPFKCSARNGDNYCTALKRNLGRSTHGNLVQ